MKRYLAIALAASFGVLSTVPAFAMSVSDYGAGVSANGIASSRHNLGSFGMHITTSNTTEICVFCHTPHHSVNAGAGATGAVNPAPLWNRSTSAASTYTPYGTTIGVSVISGVSGVSAACLSCHDGTTTFDNIANAPGKDGVTSGTDRTWSFTPEGGTASTTADSLGELDQMMFGRANLGTNLSNDHPISVIYNSTVASLRPDTTLLNSIILTEGLDSTVAGAAFSGNLNQNRWAIKGFISNSAKISDLLRDSKVECSSCHDPHFNNKSFDEVDGTYEGATAAEQEMDSNGLFLRRVGGNTGSGVCRTCHNK